MYDVTMFFYCCVSVHKGNHNKAAEITPSSIKVQNYKKNRLYAVIRRFFCTFVLRKPVVGSDISSCLHTSKPTDG